MPDASNATAQPATGLMPTIDLASIELPAGDVMTSAPGRAVRRRVPLGRVGRAGIVGVVGIVAVLTLAGCGTSAAPDAPPTTEPAATTSAGSTTPATSPAAPSSAAIGSRLTTAQALVASRMLVEDREAGGADLIVTVPSGASTGFVLRGSVDWRTHEGAVTVQATGAPEQAVLWAEGQLLMAPPGLGEAMAAKGRPGVRFASRPLRAASSTLDQVVVLIASLASDRAENPILLRQADTGFLGAGDIGGVAHDRYRYGSSVYWVDAAGRIARVEARLRSVAATVVVDLANHGQRDVALPAPDEVVAAADIDDVLTTLPRA